MPSMLQPVQTSIHARGVGNGPTVNVPDNTEALLAQRMSERSQMDKLLMSSSPAPQGMPPMLQAQSPSMPANLNYQQSMPMGVQPIQPPQQLPQQPMPPQMEQAHPEVIKKFMTFTEKEKRKFAAAQPLLYAKIINTINMQASLPPVLPQVQALLPLPAPLPLQAPLQVPIPVTLPLQAPLPLPAPLPIQAPLPAPAPIPVHVPLVTPHISQPSQPPAPTPAPPEKTSMVSIDFRTDIRDISNNKYVISLPEKQSVSAIKLESCIIPQLAQLEGEPYIYIAISEVDGDYSTNNSTVPVFGKLIQEKTVNNFIIYKPENCKKTFKSPKLLDTLKVSFLTYDRQPIQLNRLSCSRISGTKKGSLFKVTCRQPHYLSMNDKVTTNTKISNKLVSELSTVRHIVSPDTFVIDRPFGLANNTQPTVLDTTIEKTGVKCTLTFNLTLSSA